MKNTDTRVQYTKARIHDALTELMAENQFRSITVKELCDVAGINRGTFYLHYSSLRDVLAEIEEEALEETHASQEHSSKLSYEEAMLERLRIMSHDKRKYIALISQSGNPQFLSDVRNRFVLQKDDPALTEEEKAERQLRYDFFFSGTTGSVKAWLTGNISCSAELMAKTLAQLYFSIIYPDA